MICLGIGLSRICIVSKIKGFPSVNHAFGSIVEIKSISTNKLRLNPITTYAFSSKRSGLLHVFEELAPHFQQSTILMKDFTITETG
jgi:hypothetical protein